MKHFRHKNHLISSYLALQQQVQEIRDTICRGRPPTSNRDSLTPLSEDMQNAITAHLGKITELFNQLAQKYIAHELEKVMRKEPISTTSSN